MVSRIYAAAPAADIITTGENLFGDIQRLFIVAGGAAICFVMLKLLFKAPTLFSAFGVLVMAVAVLWVLSIVNDDKVRQPLDDTVDEYGMEEMPRDVLPAEGGTPS